MSPRAAGREANVSGARTWGERAPDRCRHAWSQVVACPTTCTTVTRPSAEPNHTPHMIDRALVSHQCRSDRSTWLPPTEEPGNVGSGAAQFAPDSCDGRRVC